MENTSYALQIAAGVLIAIMIIALITFVYTTLSSYQKSQDDIVARENLQEFNQAFEVYDKSLMYGTDVLSCLNQAENNNQKYVYNIYYGKDSSSVSYSDREENIIQVNVILHSNVTEKISVYYKNGNGKVTECSNTDKYNLQNKYLFSTDTTNTIFTLPTITYYYFTKDTTAQKGSVVNKVTKSYADAMWAGVNTLDEEHVLQPGTHDTTITADETYSLVADNTDDANNTARLIALLSTVTEVDQTVYNDNDTSTDSSNWYSATWTTAVYDFKTRKFTCTGIEYNENGYVSELSFEEYQGN